MLGKQQALWLGTRVAHVVLVKPDAPDCLEQSTLVASCCSHNHNFGIGEGDGHVRFLSAVPESRTTHILSCFCRPGIFVKHKLKCLGGHRGSEPLADWLSVVTDARACALQQSIFASCDTYFLPQMCHTFSPTRGD
eukprot:1160056-Pelagomonas_calceolata.AAC.11